MSNVEVTARLMVERERGRLAGRAEERASLRSLVEDLVDLEDCQFDHHGFCQTHFWMVPGSRCPHARARDFLVETEATHGSGQMPVPARPVDVDRLPPTQYYTPPDTQRAEQIPGTNHVTP